MVSTANRILPGSGGASTGFSNLCRRVLTAGHPRKVFRRIRKPSAGPAPYDQLMTALACDFDLIQGLTKSHVFYGLEDDQLKMIAGIANVRILERGETLVEADCPSCDLIVLVDGELMVLDRNERRLADLFPGACVGEIALLDQQPRSATVVAKTSAVALILPAMELWMLMERRPALGKTILFNIGRVLASRLRSSNQR